MYRLFQNVPGDHQLLNSITKLEINMKENREKKKTVQIMCFSVHYVSDEC